MNTDTPIILGLKVSHVGLQEFAGTPEDPTQLPNIFEVTDFDDEWVSLLRIEESDEATKWSKEDFYKKFELL